MNKINMTIAKNKILADRIVDVEYAGEIYRQRTAVKVGKSIYIRIDANKALYLTAKEIKIQEGGLLGSSYTVDKVSSIIEDDSGKIVYKLSGGAVLKIKC